MVAAVEAPQSPRPHLMPAQPYRQHPIRLERDEYGRIDIRDAVTHALLASDVDESFARWLEPVVSDALPFCTVDEVLDAATVACESGRIEEAERLADEYRARQMRRHESIASEVRAIALAGVGR